MDYNNGGGENENAQIDDANFISPIAKPISGTEDQVVKKM